MQLKPTILALAVLLVCGVRASAATDPIEKDFIYKKTPQAELKLVVTLPPDNQTRTSSSSPRTSH